jgi:hypothetical protein
LRNEDNTSLDTGMDSSKLLRHLNQEAQSAPTAKSYHLGTQEPPFLASDHLPRFLLSQPLDKIQVHRVSQEGDKDAHIALPGERN